MPLHTGQAILRYIARLPAVWRATVLVLLSVVLSACAAPHIPDQTAPDDSLVFGHIDVPRRLSHVYLYELGRAYIGTLNMPRATVYRNGNFAIPNLRPGRYYIAGFADRTATYWLTYSKPALEKALITVGSGQVLFAGSYQVTNVESPLFRNGTFDIRRVARPDEKTVARELLPLAAGTAWETALRKRLR